MPLWHWAGSLLAAQPLLHIAKELLEGSTVDIRPFLHSGQRFDGTDKAVDSDIDIVDHVGELCPVANDALCRALPTGELCPVANQSSSTSNKALASGIFIASRPLDSIMGMSIPRSRHHTATVTKSHLSMGPID